MVTYIALTVAAISSIVATFIKPTTKRGRVERLNKWSILFVLLPLAAFVAGVLDSRSKDRQTDHLNVTINDLHSKVERSLVRVERYHVIFKYNASLSELHIKDKILKPLHDILGPEAIITFNNRGDYQYGVSKGMLGKPSELTGDDLLIYKTMETCLLGKRPVQRPIIYFLKTSQNRSGISYLREALRGGPGELTIDNSTIGVPMYARDLLNPIYTQIGAVQNVDIQNMTYDWIILDKDAEDPVLTLIWEYTFYSVQGSGFEYVDDYRNGKIVAFVPRFNPNFGGPSDIFIPGPPFGTLAFIQLDAGGMRYIWSADDHSRSTVQVMATDYPDKGEHTAIGWLAELTSRTKNEEK